LAIKHSKNHAGRLAKHKKTLWANPLETRMSRLMGAKNGSDGEKSHKRCRLKVG
jgi:hypothetical protein